MKPTRKNTYEKIPDLKGSPFLKDSGDRTELSGGMFRDIQEDRERFDLLVPLKIPYNESYLYRIAKHYARGAKKYADRNWEKADSLDNYNSFKQSAFRHFMQLMSGDTSEDHASALFFNVQGMIYTEYIMKQKGTWKEEYR